MFFTGRGEPIPKGSEGGNDGYGPVGNGVNEPGCSLWISIILPNIVNVISLALNLFCFVIMARKCMCTFTSAQNMLMMVLMLVMVESSINNIILSILSEVLVYQMPIIAKINQMSDMFVTYFSIVVIFFVGFHRMCVYTEPRIIGFVFPRKHLSLILIVLALGCMALAILVINECGIRKEMSTEGFMVDYVNNLSLLKTTNYIAYAVAISSTLFYVRIYFHLRSHRVNVVNDKTKEMLNKAEIFNCYQGAFVLLIYSVSLVTFVISDTVDFDDSVMWLLHAVQEIINALPTLGIPLAILLYCPLMRQNLRKIFRGEKRTGSASSLRLTRRSTIAVSF